MIAKNTCGLTRVEGIADLHLEEDQV